VTPRLSVVIPAFNAESTIGETVRAIITQPIARELFECIVVDDSSSDHTAEVAERAGATVVRLSQNRGRCAARNIGTERARGEWIVFTDADCVPSRRWLSSFLSAIESADRSTLAFAGKIVGLNSITPAARFADLTGALDAEIYLDNKVLSWAPSGNLALRRADLLAVGGFDTRFKSYEAADLELRMSERFGGKIVYVRTAIVMHHHRASWRDFWKQQINYGEGYGQFLLRYADRWPWSLRCETFAWARLLPLALRAAIARGEQRLLQRGLLTKHAAQRIGFVSTHFSSTQRRVMRTKSTGTPASQSKKSKPLRMRGSGLPLWLAVGHFILRAPARLARTELPVFLARVAAQPRNGADFKRVAKITQRWLRLPGLRSRNTCYLRSLVLFRFVDPRQGELCLHFGVDELRDPSERLHGHSWVSLNGVALNPPQSFHEERIQEIYRFSTLSGSSSTSGATAVAAIIRGTTALLALTPQVPA
jgi:glycosyltransferase involved in cell wall biosynthesis